MRKILYLFLLLLSSNALAANSTIDPNYPALHNNVTSTGLRTQFTRAYNDITALSPYSLGLEDSTGQSLTVPLGSTSQRPLFSVNGMLRYNTTTSSFEGYTGTWGSIGGGTPGGTSGQLQWNSSGAFAGATVGNNIAFVAGNLDTTQPQPRKVFISTDPITSADCGIGVLYNYSGAIAATIPAASSSGMTSGCAMDINTIGAGTATITPATGTIGGRSNLPISQYTGCYIYSDGTNWQIDYANCPAIPPASFTNVAFNTPTINNPTFTGGVIEKLRTVTAAGDITVSPTTDYFICVKKNVGAATNVNLPASPATGLQYIIKDCKGDAATNNISIVPASGTIDGSSFYVMTTNYLVTGVIYNGTEWSVE